MTVTMTFGRHEGKALTEIPTQYIEYALHSPRFKLSAFLRQRMGEELRRRGIEPPPAGPAREPVCPRHPGVGFLCSWKVDSLGRRHVRATCATCGRNLGFVPAVGEYAEMADLAGGVTGRQEVQDR
jgi:hypothetical protein